MHSVFTQQFEFRFKFFFTTETQFFNLPRSLRFCNIGRNHEASMNEYLKNNLILGDSLEISFDSITLVLEVIDL